MRPVEGGDLALVDGSVGKESIVLPGDGNNGIAEREWNLRKGEEDGADEEVVQRQAARSECR
jgi:hypothetical protein